MQQTTFSKEQVTAILTSIQTIIEKTKKDTVNWSSKSSAVILGSTLIIASLIGTVIFYIMTKQIAPLMILLGALMPILCFGIYQSSKTIDTLHREFHEYNDNVEDLMELFSLSEDDITLTSTVKEALQKITAESDDICNIISTLDNTDIDTIQDTVMNKHSFWDSLTKNNIIIPTSIPQTDIIPIDKEKNINPITGEDLSLRV